jgi:uncharacterized protein (TIGR02421 family)
MRKDLNDIISSINKGQKINTTTSDGAISIKISKYVPFICMAIHNGSRLRNDLLIKTALDEYERWYEEDPLTGDFITSLPITLIANDSRYEYDLNRDPENAVYEEAWGKNVWNKKLTPKNIQQSKTKHNNFYKLLHALIQKLESQYGKCLIFDIHSYNYKRLKKDVPLFNVGTENLNLSKYESTINFWVKELANIALPNITNKTEINSVFYGRGYCTSYVNNHFKHTLILPTEIKKVYCDESTGDIYPDVVKEIQKNLKQSIINTVNHHLENDGSDIETSYLKYLDKGIDPKLLHIDKKLFNLLRNFELLATVNPTNSSSEKNRFFRNKFRVLPKFKYSPIKINSFELKQKLLSVHLDQIQDIYIRNLYESVINSYFDKIDLIASRGNSNFIYNSLRYFGRPSSNDLHNADYILHLPNIPNDSKKQPYIKSDIAYNLFKESIAQYGLEAKVEYSSKVISQVMALNSSRKILIQPHAKFLKKELYALLEHEIGVHMVTTMNSYSQKLRVFNLGLPVNTETQEGLAILAEYLCGNITLNRLRKFALRTIAVNLLCTGADFVETFSVLNDNYQIEPDDAYSIVARVYRGGGFTKDHLYLSGFVKILKYWNDHHDLEPLLVGKTSLEYIDIIEEMIEREMIDRPKYITRSFVEPKVNTNDKIYSYILSGLK